MKARQNMLNSFAFQITQNVASQHCRPAEKNRQSKEVRNCVQSNTIYTEDSSESVKLVRARKKGQNIRITKFSVARDANSRVKYCLTKLHTTDS